MILIILIMLLFIAGAIKGYLDKNRKLCIFCTIVIIVNVLLGFYMNYLSKL